MIISHKHKFIFLKTRKTAGTSIEIALSSICGKDDIITPISAKDEEVRKKLGYRGPQNYHIPISKYSKLDIFLALRKAKRKRFFNHMTAEEITQYIDAGIWESYFKFTFERNPYDKAVSSFYWKGGAEQHESFESYLVNGGLNNLKSYELYSINKIPAVDKVYRFESINDDLKELSTQLNLKVELKLPNYKAKSGFREQTSYRDQYNERSKDIIDLALARELKFLDYKF